MKQKQPDTVREIMRQMGRKGGKAAAKKLTAEERSARARKAGQAPKKRRTGGQQ